MTDFLNVKNHSGQYQRSECCNRKVHGTSPHVDIAHIASDRLKPFMYGLLTQSEFVEAVLSMKVMTLPRRAGRKRRSKA
jgi:hypothetical protein